MTRLLLAALLLLQGQEARARYAEKLAATDEYFWKERFSLAEWCRSKGLHREARIHLEFMAANIPGMHPYKSKATAALKGSWKKKPNMATSEVITQYYGKLEDYYRTAGEKAFDAYVVARDGKLKKEAGYSLQDSIQMYYDNPRARKERGEEKVDGFGWVSKEEAEHIRTTLIDLATEKRPMEELEKEDGAHASWDQAWVVRSKRYILRSDLPLRKIREALDLLEKLYDLVTAWLEKTIAEPPQPLAVCFFRRGADLEEARARLPGTPPVAAFFHGMTNIIYLRSFDGDEGAAVGRNDQELLLHEATHQLLDMGTEQKIFSICQEPNLRSQTLTNYWIVEGVATYFGTLRWEKQEARVGLSDWRMAQARASKTGFRDFLAMGYKEFHADARANYSLAFAFARFLIHGKEGAYKRKLLEFLKEYYLGNGSVASFEKTVGKADELEKEFRAWLGQ